MLIGMGQRTLYPLGIYDIPIINCHNACATGSNALFLARQMVGSGINECALAVGVEKMKPGSLGGGAPDGSPTMLDTHYKVLNDKFPIARAPPMAQFFGNAGREHMKKYGTKLEHFAKVAGNGTTDNGCILTLMAYELHENVEKNHKHSANNPYAQFKTIYSLDEIMNSPKVYDPLTKLQCSPTSDGAGAAIVCSEDFVKKHKLEGQAVEIIGQSMRTDNAAAFEQQEGREIMEVIGYTMAKKTAEDVYAQAGLNPDDVNVVELHVSWD